MQPVLLATELITNGGFETTGGGFTWVLQTEGSNQADSWWNIDLPSGAHGGNRYEYLGATTNGFSSANNVDGTLYQTVTIPSGVASATLTYWIKITTDEDDSGQFDHFYVEVRNTSGTVRQTVHSYSNLNSGTYSSWTKRTASLLSYAGQTVRLAFHGTTDSSVKTVFRVDDVSIITTGTQTLPDKATSPSPASGATVSAPSSLSWSNGGGATSYRVFFGTDSTPDNGENKGTQTGTTFTPPTLTAGTTYYWKINPINAAGEKTGDVWSFTVAQEVTLPTARTDAATNLSATGATLNATVTNTGGATITDARFEYTATSFPGTVIYSVPVSGNQFSHTLTGLQPSTTYTVHSFAKNSLGWSAASNNLTFTTSGGNQGEPASLGVIWHPSPNFNSRPVNQVIDAIVIHTLEDDYIGGRNTLTNPTNEKSAHYVISETGEISQLVSLDKRAWHANYFNDRSIGIEMAGFAGQANTWNPQNLGALENLVAYLVQKYGIPINHPAGSATNHPPNYYYNQPGLVAHAQIQDGSNDFEFRSDPGPHFPWATFVQNVQAKVAGNSDTINPSIVALGASPSSAVLGSSFTINYTVSDSGGSGLKRVELWRANIDGTSSDSSWQQIGSPINLSGNGPTSGSFADTPTTVGTYWYGLHVVDNANNLMDERTAGLGPLECSVLPGITLIAPNGGETWQAGSTQEITWSSTGVSGNVRIVLSVNGNPLLPDIASSTANDGSYSWTIPSNQTPQDNYEIYIEPVGGSIYDISEDQFTISAVTPIPTRVISLSGSLAFGNVNVGSSSGATMTISNTGNSTLSVSSITYPSGFSGSWSGGTIAASSSQNVTVTFSPSSETSYNGTITVNSDKTSGTNTISCSGTGTAVATPVETWRQTYFGSTDNTGDGADLNDFDKDGIPNLLEFAFGLHPKQNSAGMLPQPQRTGSNLVISFTQPTGVSGVTYGAEWSETLAPGSWTAISNSGTLPQHTYSLPNGTKAMLYMRLKVTNP